MPVEAAASVPVPSAVPGMLPGPAAPPAGDVMTEPASTTGPLAFAVTVLSVLPVLTGGA